MPTKTEQADLLMAMYGRNGDRRCRDRGATPADCFDCAYEAVRIAIKYMTPVILLTDGHLANGAEPWLVPTSTKLPEIKVEFRDRPEGFMPYMRDQRNAVAPVGGARHARPGASHRRPSREDLTGNVSYAPANHEQMVRMRARKIAGIAREIPPTEIFGDAERRRPAGARLGFHLRRDARGGQADAREGQEASRTSICAT